MCLSSRPDLDSKGPKKEVDSAGSMRLHAASVVMLGSMVEHDLYEAGEVMAVKKIPLISC